MFPPILLSRRVARTFRHAWTEEEFRGVFLSALLLIATGTAVYAIGNGWGVVDALYFSVTTLTTSTSADPDLVLTDGWMKVFTVLYILTGIGVLVEFGRRFGMAFLETRRLEGPAVRLRRQRQERSDG